MQTVTKWEQEGLPVAERGGRGRASLYDVSAVREWTEARAAAAEQPGGGLDLVQERANKERMQAKLVEQMYLTRQGRLLPAEDVERVWMAEVAAVRAKLLAWPATLADRLHRAGLIEGAGGIERELTDAVREVLRELADPSRPVLTTTAPAGPPGTAA